MPNAKTLIEPPFTNRWNAHPGPDYRRCAGETRAAEQCRRGAKAGSYFCDQHEGKTDATP